MFQIVNDRLAAGGRPVAFVPSPNAGGRIEPALIVLHDTADRLRPDDSVSWFKDPKSKVSAHFVVGRDGSVVQMVECGRAAYHAGKSSWKGRAGCNGFAVGIEIDNPGSLKATADGGGLAWFGERFDRVQHGLVESNGAPHGRALWLPYTRAQLDAVEGIVRALLAAYPTIADIAGHFEVSPGRKVDVGPQFPLPHFRALLGNRSAPDKDLVMRAQQRLAELNYWPGSVDGTVSVKTRAAIRTFEEQNNLPITGTLSPATQAALLRDGAREMPNAAREGATKADLRAAGSEIMGGASQTKRTSEAGIALNFMDALAQVEQVRASHGVLDWLASPGGIRVCVTFAVLAFIWKFADRIEWARLRDFMTGRNAGGPK